MRDQEGRRKGSGQDRHLAGLMFAFANLTRVQGHFARSETTSQEGLFLLKARLSLNPTM